MIWTDEQVQWVVDFIAQAGPAMELAGWRIRLEQDYPESADAAAQIHCVYGKKFAQLWLRKDFFDNPFETASQYLVHELCHLYADPCDKLVETLATPLGTFAHGAFVAAFNMQSELMVDTIAHAIVNLLDLDDLECSYGELTA